MVLLKMLQHRVPIELTFTTLDEAMSAAWANAEYNQGYPEKIIDGDKSYTFDDMQKY